jgi:hypothetical protein
MRDSRSLHSRELQACVVELPSVRLTSGIHQGYRIESTAST